MLKVTEITSLPVVIVNYHGYERLKECLEALSTQTHPFTEIVIVDNGSSESERAELETLIQSERIRVIFSPENLGFAKANNLAFPLLKSYTHVALLNPDAIPAPDWLEQMACAIQKFPDTSAFGSFMAQYHHPDLIDGLGDCYHVSGLAWRKGHGKKHTNKKLESRLVFSVCAAAACYKTSVLNELNGFDEDLFCYHEDVDLGFRIQLLGGSCRFIPEAKVRHVGLESSRGKNDFSFYHGHRNLEWVYLKNMPLFLLILFLPLHLMMILVMLGVSCYRGQVGSFLKAKVDSFVKLPHFFRKRRSVISVHGVMGIRLLSKFSYLPNFRHLKRL